MKNEKQHRLLFIIPAVIIAIILIICIAVAVSSKSGEKGKKKDSRSVSVTENTQDIVAESETLELVKKDALKETNVVDKDNKQNNGTQSDTNDNSTPAAGNSDNANTASDKSSGERFILHMQVYPKRQTGRTAHSQHCIRIMARR